MRLGILAAGRIAAHFAAAMPESKHCELVAIGSRDQSKADEFAARFSIPKTHGSYQALLDDPNIDAVYIATPNGAHPQWAIKAANAGKHVLCEKPLAITVAEVEEMFAAADRNRVQLIEAFPFRFQPTTISALEHVRSGRIGKIVTGSACFGFKMTREKDVRLDPEQGPGSVWDVGCYAINVLRAFFGVSPSQVSAAAKLHPLGFDVTASAVLGYADGRSATLWSSFETGLYRRVSIVGEDGAVEYDFSNHTANEEEASYRITTSSGTETVRCKPGNGFALEADAFAELVANPARDFHGTTRQETIENTRTAIAIIESYLNGGDRKSR